MNFQCRKLNHEKKKLQRFQCKISRCFLTKINGMSNNNITFFVDKYMYDSYYRCLIRVLQIKEIYINSMTVGFSLYLCITVLQFANTYISERNFHFKNLNRKMQIKS